MTALAERKLLFLTTLLIGAALLFQNCNFGGDFGNPNLDGDEGPHILFSPFSAKIDETNSLEVRGCLHYIRFLKYDESYVSYDEDGDNVIDWDVVNNTSDAEPPFYYNLPIEFSPEGTVVTIRRLPQGRFARAALYFSGLGCESTESFIVKNAYGTFSNTINEDGAQNGFKTLLRFNDEFTIDENTIGIRFDIQEITDILKEIQSVEELRTEFDVHNLIEVY